MADKGKSGKWYGCKREFLQAAPTDQLTTTSLLEQSPIHTGMNYIVNILALWPS